MFKNLVFIVLSFFTYFALQDGEISSFEYIASTRGSTKKVFIRKDSTFVFDQEEEIKIITKKDDWIVLNEKIAKINLKKLQRFEAPSNNRNSDRALAARLSVITKHHTYYSSEFDHGNPPEDIKLIVAILTNYLPSK